MPTGWTPDGKSIIGSYGSPPLSPPFTNWRAKLALWPLTPSPAQTERALIEDPRSALWQGSFSPNGRWLTFFALSLEDVTRAGIYVAREGSPPAEWIRIAANHPRLTSRAGRRTGGSFISSRTRARRISISGASGSIPIAESRWAIRFSSHSSIPRVWV